MTKTEKFIVLVSIVIFLLVAPAVAHPLNDKWTNDYNEGLEKHINKHSDRYDKCMEYEVYNEQAACFDYYDYDKYYMSDRQAFDDHIVHQWTAWKGENNDKPTGIAGWLIGIVAATLASLIVAVAINEVSQSLDNARYNRIYKRKKKQERKEESKKALAEIEAKSNTMKLEQVESVISGELSIMLRRIYDLEQSVYRFEKHNNDAKINRPPKWGNTDNFSD